MQLSDKDLKALAEASGLRVTFVGPPGNIHEGDSAAIRRFAKAIASARDDRDADIEALKAQLDLAPLCAEHSKPGGKRALCLVCACRDLSAALSRISYLCGEPNEMQCGPYDLHCDENAVVEQVRAYCEQLRAEARKEG